jgi:hypothetical protein
MVNVLYPKGFARNSAEEGISTYNMYPQNDIQGLTMMDREAALQSQQAFGCTR